jgi:hypothetical protein
MNPHVFEELVCTSENKKLRNAAFIFLIPFCVPLFNLQNFLILDFFPFVFPPYFACAGKSIWFLLFFKIHPCKQIKGINSQYD